MLTAYLALGAGATFPGKYFRMTSPYSLINWEITDNFVYKLFPDVLAFYLFVVSVVLVSVAAHRWPRVRLLLHRRIWVSIYADSVSPHVFLV